MAGVPSGSVEPGFGAAADAFAQGFEQRGELGAAIAVVIEQRLVVDLWGGTADGRGRPWREDTLVNVFSVGKPLAATCLLALVDAGAVSLDGTVASVWPEFAAAGKEAVTIRQVLAHQAGLDLFHEPLAVDDLLDWERATRLLASARPRWPPGTTHGEHAAFYGHLVGEIVRRIDGRPLGAFFREEVAEPWRLDAAFGVTDDEAARAADVADPDGAFARDMRASGETYRLALDNPPAMLIPEVVNGDVWRRADVPAVNAHATARAVARFYAGLGNGGELDGERLLTPQLVHEAVAAPQQAGLDEVLGHEVGWGLGVQVDDDGFGMGGIGGSGGWWSRDGYAFAYVTRRLGTHVRALVVENALREALGLEPLADE